MKAILYFNQKQYQVDLAAPIDISLAIATTGAPIAWYLEHPEIKPVRFGNWEGSVQAGASTNFNNIHFNPHGHGTHTECLGHITHDLYSVHALLKKHFFLSQLISIEPEKQGDDMVITRQQLQDAMAGSRPEALVIRTIPNKLSKKTTNYSHTNPPYLEAEAATYLCELGILHLLVDLPSVDREEDQGRLAAHRAFWHINNINPVNPDARFQATITELIFVPNEVPDGLFILNLQVASFENDAAPSRPVLYQIIHTE